MARLRPGRTRVAVVDVHRDRLEFHTARLAAGRLRGGASLGA